MNICDPLHAYTVTITPSVAVLGDVLLTEVTKVKGGRKDETLT